MNGFALTDFHLDWEGERATCPVGIPASAGDNAPIPPDEMSSG
jgi:hypothetical protein